MFLSAVTRSTYGALRHCVRTLSVSNASSIGIKERMRKFITENPHLMQTDTKNLNLPAVKQLTQTQEELLRQIEEVDVDHNPNVFKYMSPNNSEQNPELVPASDVRQVAHCICEVDGHFTRASVLYRDLPHRCYCGKWLKLVDWDTYEREREKKWAEIKDEPYHVELMEKFEEAEKLMNAMLEKGKTMTLKSPKVDDFLVAMNAQWTHLLDIYREIRSIMDNHLSRKDHSKC